MRARIYQPARTAMSSGTAKTHKWFLEFTQTKAREVDPLMGWTSSSDTQTQVRLQFDTREEAVEYAKENNIVAQVREPQPASPISAQAAMERISQPIVAARGRIDPVVNRGKVVSESG